MAATARAGAPRLVENDVQLEEAQTQDREYGSGGGDDGGGSGAEHDDVGEGYADGGGDDDDALAQASGNDIAYWQLLQARARRKAARALERSTQLEHDIDHLDTLANTGGYVSRHNPPSYFDEVSGRQLYVPGVGSYDVEQRRRRATSAGLLRNGSPDRDLWGDQERRAAAIPAVGQYNPRGSHSTLSARSLPLRTSRVESADLARRKHQRLVPGPGRYFISGDITRVTVGPVLSSATRGKNPFDLAIERSLELPAPDAYHLPQLGDGIKGGVISTAVPPRSMDLAEAHGKELPGPGDYSPKQGGVGYGVGGGRISEARPQSDVDVMQRRAKAQPGPGQYTVGSTLRRNGGVVSESRIPPLFRDQLRVAREGPSPGTYADGVLRQAAAAREQGGGGAVPRARMKRFYETDIARSKGVPGPGGNTRVRSTLSRSGGVMSTAYPKSDVEWQIHRAKQLPGPKYTITNPDTTKMEKVRQDALDLYRREYGTGGEDPYKLVVAARTAGVPAHERLYQAHAPKRKEARKKRALRAASASRRYENRAKLYAYSDKYRHETIEKATRLYGRETGEAVLRLEDAGGSMPQEQQRLLVRNQSSDYLLLRDPNEEECGGDYDGEEDDDDETENHDNDEDGGGGGGSKGRGRARRRRSRGRAVQLDVPVDREGNNIGVQNMILVAHDMEGQGSLQDAAEVFTAALGLVPLMPKTRERLLLLRAVALAKAGRPRKALASAEQCIADNPRSTKGWYRKGLLLQSLGRFDEAQGCFDRMSAITLGDTDGGSGGNDDNDDNDGHGDGGGSGGGGGE